MLSKNGFSKNKGKYNIIISFLYSELFFFFLLLQSNSLVSFVSRAAATVAALLHLHSRL